ncbi:hemagglutinin repeat-containing protein [Paraburkholderia tropica]|uniref:hemagglutinin repeat-containing protein n=1 Tax=Paraburkholderia tropica TaxID=92647 RepID=UPI002AB712F8|nr:hemagglutinin repeat-containing protein [Paraburkholderia tropica]
MNRNFRLVYSRVRHMVVVVEETATASRGRGKGEVVVAAAMVLAGMAAGAQAQVVAGGAHAPQVQTTPNATPLVNLQTPSKAGVSMNTYGQFDVDRRGVVLNNSGSASQSQLAGYVAGNPNYTPGQSARVIVNQVNSASPSRLNGYVEALGPTPATVILANPSGITTDGGGFINTARAVLTTGLPQLDGNGALTGYSAMGPGAITVQGAGFNASNVDQVDLIARAVKVNAALFAQSLNVVTGAGAVDDATLKMTPAAGDGMPPAVSIDVSNLGGMYAGKIFLASNSYGVGVSNAGTIAAQSGDLSLQADGKLVLTGNTTASGNLNLSASQGIQNSGVTYSQHALTASTAGAFTNTGTAAAQQDVRIAAESVASSGTLGAGVASDGSVSRTGNLAVDASKSLVATGHNVAGGDIALTGASLDLHGGNTSAAGNITLGASAGDANLKGSTLAADGSVTTRTSGTLTTDSASVSSGGAQSHTAGALSNVKGQLVSASTLTEKIAGAATNQGGIQQAAGALKATFGTLDNSAGSILSLNGDGLNLGVTGTLVNGLKGVIGSNGNIDLAAYSFKNAGSVTALKAATLKAWGITNSGSMLAGSTLTLAATGTLRNSGLLSAVTTAVSGVTLDNSGGDIEGTTVTASTTGDLVNQGGSIAQSGTGAQTVRAGGTLDNSGGKIASNATNLVIDAVTLRNDAGTIAHAGKGALKVTARSDLSNVDGQIATNGALDSQSGSLDNTGGVMTAQATAQIASTGGINNARGLLYGENGLSASAGTNFNNSGGAAQSAGETSVSAGQSLGNSHGSITANGAHDALIVRAADIDNSAGVMTNAGDGDTSLSATNDIRNTGGTAGGNGNVTLTGRTLENDSGAQLVAGGVAKADISGSLTNTGGMMYGAKGLSVDQSAGESGTVVNNDAGQMLSGGDLAARVGSLSNQGGAIRANGSIDAAGAMGGEGEMTAGGRLALDIAGDYTNGAANRLSGDGGINLQASGNVTNLGSLATPGTLNVNGANVYNASVFNAGVTNVAGAYSINNTGLISGNTVTTNSPAFFNTGSVIGYGVTMYANDILNTGSSALLAAAQQLNLYAQNSLINQDGASIYSGGNIEMARDGARDGQGMLANQMNALTNSAASIQAEGNIDAAVYTMNNLRVGVQVAPGDAQTTGNSTLTWWTDGMSIAQLGDYLSLYYDAWNWEVGKGPGGETVNKLATPLTITVPKSQVTNLNTGAQTFSLTQPLEDMAFGWVQTEWGMQPGGFTRTITTNPVQYYQSIVDNGGTYAITFWPDYNPNTNIRPDQVQVRTDLGVDQHDYIETSRTATTTTQTDQLVNAGTGAVFQAGGSIRTNTDNGSLNNYASTMAAGIDLVRRADNGSVNDTGVVLQQTTTTQSTSVFDWWQKTGSGHDTQTVDNGVVQSVSTVDAVAAIASGNAGVQTDAASINVTSVDRKGETVTGAGVSGGDASAAQPGSVSSAGRKPQTVGGTTGGVPDLKLPTNALYRIITAPGSDYLIETDPRFTNVPVVDTGRSGTGGNAGNNTSSNTGNSTGSGGSGGTTTTTSSNYLIGLLGYNPQEVEKRLGDGYYEMQLIRNQVTQLTGRTYLGGYSSNLDEYTALMNSGATWAKTFNLSLGIALSADQMAQLTTDMVWMVSQTVTLPDGSQQNVLVPTLYLAKTNTVDLKDTGAVVTGATVVQNATGSVTNSGKVAGDLATTIVGNTITNRGVIDSGGATKVAAVEDVNNIGGQIGGVDTVVSAGRDVNNVSTTQQATASSGNAGFASRVTQTSVTSVASISGSNSAGVLAGRDINLTGAVVKSGGDALLAAGRDINAGTVTLERMQDVGTRDGLNGGHTQQTVHVGSAITADGNVVMGSGRDTNLANISVKAGDDLTVAAGRDLNVGAAKDTSTYSGQSMGGANSQGRHSSYDERVQGSSLAAGGSVVLAAGQDGTGDLNVAASSVTADRGGAKLLATGNVTLGEVTETHDAQGWSHSTSGSAVASTTTTDSYDRHEVVAVGSTVSGDTVTGAAAHNLAVSGSTVAATHDLALSAGDDLTIRASQNTSQSSTSHEERKSGFGAMSGGGASFNYGTRDQKDIANDAAVTNNAALVGSTDGSVKLDAGKALSVTGSDVIAAKDVTGTGETVTIEAAQGATHHDESHEMKQSGVSVGLAGTVGDAINNTINEAEAAGRSVGSDNSRAAALHGIASAGDFAMAGAMSNGGSKPDIGVQVSFGTSQSRSDAREDRTTHTASKVQAGGEAAFTATGGDLTVAGSDITAKDVALAAKDRINLVNTTDTDSTRSSNSSSSASVGVSYSLGGGFGVSASMQTAHGDANSDAATQSASHINGDSVSIRSGGDTNVIGSQVNANTIKAEVGGDLNVRSVQDTASSAAHQSSAGGGFSITQYGGGSASFTAQNGHAAGDYAGVNEQAGLYAGDGGFNVNVKGNTDLQGGVIDSTADASKNSLTTGTLTYSDLTNHSHYSATSAGISVGAASSAGSGGKSVGPGSVPGSGGVLPMIVQHDSDDQSATTRSAVAAGTISITDGVSQKQDVAGLSRDTADTNGQVSKLPDVKAMLDRQADTMQAAQAAGQVVTQGIGAYADAKARDALDTAKLAMERGDLDGMAAALSDFESWSEGGNSRAGLHLAGGALIGGLGGGSAFGAVGGAAGAGLSSKLADQTKAAASAVTDATNSSLVGSITGNILSGLAGGLAGGSAGASLGADVNLYNQGNNKNDTEAKSEAAELRKFLEKERAMLGQASAKVPKGTEAQAVTVNAPAGALVGGAGRSKADILRENKAKGDAFEANRINSYRSGDTIDKIETQVTLQVGDGTKTRMDIMTKDKAGSIGCVECKSSEKAPLTPNQERAFPQIATGGAVVVGKGKPGFPGGTVIPPTTVEIVRPSAPDGGK